MTGHISPKANEPAVPRPPSGRRPSSDRPSSGRPSSRPAAGRPAAKAGGKPAGTRAGSSKASGKPAFKAGAKQGQKADRRSERPVEEPRTDGHRTDRTRKPPKPDTRHPDDRHPGNRFGGKPVRAFRDDARSERDDRPRREDRSAFRPDRPERDSRTVKGGGGLKDRRPSHLRPMGSRKVSEGAIALLDAISSSREPADRVRHKWMRDHHRGFDEAERDALIQLSEEVLRLRGRIDWWITQGKTALPPDNRLRLATYRILQMGAKAEGLLQLFAPDDAIEALLRRLEGHTLDHPDMPLAARLSVPDWIMPLFRQRFGADLELELAAMLRPAPLDLRVNTLKTTRQAATAALQSEGLSSQHAPYSPVGLRLSPRAYANNTKAYAEGLVEPQDEGSQLAAQLVDAKGAKFVVDYCAGAAGKTLVLASAMQNNGRLVAMDVNVGRLTQAKLRLRRAGVHNAETRELDGKWVKRHAGKADRVLVDAPCTGTGTWRRKPDAKWRLEQRDLNELVPRQAEILDRAARLVRDGGRLVYVTCSVLRQENEEQVEAFMKRNPEFRIVAVNEVWTKLLGSACPVPGPFLSLSPGRHGTDGFFAAILQRDS